MSLSQTLKKAKLPRTLSRFPQKKERKQVTSYTIDGVRIKERKKVKNTKFIILLIQRKYLNIKF